MTLTIATFYMVIWFSGDFTLPDLWRRMVGLRSVLLVWFDHSWCFGTELASWLQSLGPAVSGKLHRGIKTAKRETLQKNVARRFWVFVTIGTVTTLFFRRTSFEETQKSWFFFSKTTCEKSRDAWTREWKVLCLRRSIENMASISVILSRFESMTVGGDGFI